MRVSVSPLILLAGGVVSTRAGSLDRGIGQLSSGVHDLEVFGGLVGC